ncbi:thiamine/thiamine pyrophosphate ABC transporter permease ThiP [Primorskyibacter flagellatus]|uniref:Thiamine/thiamine pyrophosphate ABC transporter permease ThiP n=1 Tax=Primorskyibacter flagellatus TaxID=1387277 RepID=A0A917A9H3_9RHOB|nr:thiamine/thiamine pyrophosphate ABC transporter permease ThiP [Primorskyibacter flagellatus]GGE36647.1 thiamine/thiamine pyrophosphate ABC transporter permease ThiP [Primorskyibacter flagellatus]
MARGSLALRIGGAAALAVAVLVLAPLVAVLWRAGGAGWPTPADWSALRFTVLQAALSALFSALLAIPVARALARRRFPGRDALILLMGAPFILPVIAAIAGLLAIFGRNGLVNRALEAVGSGPIDIFGLHGVLLAHVFFNLPLAVRLLLDGWRAIPGERLRLAAQLDLPPATVFRLIEWPMLRARIPGILAVVFAICLSSFAVVLILGGGPAATTIELAIYQAFTFDFDLGKAATLAALQLVIVTFAAAAALSLSRSEGPGAGLDRMVVFAPVSPLLRLQDAAVLIATTVFVALPILMLLTQGAGSLTDMPPVIWTAALISVGVALASAALSVLLGLALALPRRNGIESIGMMTHAASALVLGTGLFLLLRPFTYPGNHVLAITAVVNAASALPFVLRSLSPDLRAAEADWGRLADSLNLTGWSRLRCLILPRLRRPLGFAAGLAAALSMGDLGVIALFPPPDAATLPLQIYRLMGAYRMETAAAASLLLVALSFGIFALFDRIGRHADA